MQEAAFVSRQGFINQGLTGPRRAGLSVGRSVGRPVIWYVYALEAEIEPGKKGKQLKTQRWWYLPLQFIIFHEPSVFFPSFFTSFFPSLSLSLSISTPSTLLASLLLITGAIRVFNFRKFRFRPLSWAQLRVQGMFHHHMARILVPRYRTYETTMPGCSWWWYCCCCYSKRAEILFFLFLNTSVSSRSGDAISELSWIGHS